MHHTALKATPEQFGALVATLEEKQVRHSLHGSKDAGSIYLRDPDGMLVEVTTGYSGQWRPAGY